MVTLRQDTPELRQSAVNLVLVEGLSARKAAKNLGIPIHTIYIWVTSTQRGTGGLTTPIAIDPAARLRKLEAQHQNPRIECSESKLKTVAQARSPIFKWIEVWYPRERLHSSLLSHGYLSPEQFEVAKRIG